MAFTTEMQQLIQSFGDFLRDNFDKINQRLATIDDRLQRIEGTTTSGANNGVPTPLSTIQGAPASAIIANNTHMAVITINGAPASKNAANSNTNTAIATPVVATNGAPASAIVAKDGSTTMLITNDVHATVNATNVVTPTDYDLALHNLATETEQVMITAGQIHLQRKLKEPQSSMASDIITKVSADLFPIPFSTMDAPSPQTPVTAPPAPRDGHQQVPTTKLRARMAPPCKLEHGTKSHRYSRRPHRMPPLSANISWHT